MTETTSRVGADTVVTLAYRLFDEEGEAVGGAPVEEPLQYVHGYGQIVPGLERQLDGLKVGDHVEVVVEAEEAFGEHDDEGVFEVDRADFPESEAVTPGDEFVAEGPDGE